MNHPYTKFRVQHFPQIPCKPFEYEFDTLQEAVSASDALSYYDLFLFKNNHRVDYANASVVGGWDSNDEEWYDLDDYEIEEILELDSQEVS